MAKKTKPDEFVFHCLTIKNYEIGYSVHPGDEGTCEEYFNFDLEVELDDPPKGVQPGSLILYGRMGMCGGSIHYRSDRELHGCIWMGPHGAVAMATVLASGVVPKLVLSGSPFVRRQARIRDVSWYTPGHPEVAEG